MVHSNNDIPVPTLHLFPVLDKLLIELLQSLTEAEWHSPTIAKQWTVKDIAAHLLDGSVRGLSILRDGYMGEKPDGVTSYTDLVQWLNELNATWVRAAKRISPALLIELLEITSKQFSAHLTTLSPFEPAVFSVAWAGQEVSPNWFHIAREYTEKFLHQQQIRHAVGKPGLIIQELFHPFISTFMQGMPHAYRNVVAPEGTVVVIKVISDAGGTWGLVRKPKGWELTDMVAAPACTIAMEPDTAWQLFSKGISPQQARELVQISGNEALGLPALQLVAVMA